MDAANLAGNLYLQNKQYKEALTEFTRVINSHLFSKRRLAQTYVDRAMTYDRLHNADAAIADYSSAIKLNNVLGHAYLYRANDFCGQGNFKKAFADYSFVASYTEHLPVEKLPAEMAEARNGLYKFRANYYKVIKRPDLAKADLIKLKQLQKEEMDLSPFLLK